MATQKALIFFFALRLLKAEVVEAEDTGRPLINDFVNAQGRKKYRRFFSSLFYGGLSEGEEETTTKSPAEISFFENPPMVTR